MDAGQRVAAQPPGGRLVRPARGRRPAAAPGPAGRARARTAATLRGIARRPWVITAALSVAVVGAGQHGPDFPAQAFRVWLFRAHGTWLFDGRWFAGHLLPGYSLLFPPLAAAAGTAAVGVASTVASAWLACRIVAAVRPPGRPETVALLWWSVITVADLVVGRLTFALGLALGLAAVLAVVRRRTVPAGVLAAAAALASPLAGAFLLLGGAGWLARAGRRLILPGAAVLLALGVEALLGGSDGPFPFLWSGLLPILLAAVAGLTLCWRRHPGLRWFLLLYAACSVALFVAPNPVGGNMTRLGTLLAGPVAAWLALDAGRRRTLLLLAGPLLFWQLQPVYAALASSVGDPSAQPGYYTGLVRYLRAHDRPLGRIEIPLTRDHWETFYVAAELPLARGWERQTDIADDGVLYRAGLTVRAYHAWLARTGVRYVALPDVPLDASSLAEAQVIAGHPGFLEPVWHDAHWRVWRVRGTDPLIHGAGARLTRLGVGSFTATFPAAGRAVVRVRYTRFLQVTAGAGCAAAAPGGWTAVRAARPGTVTVGARVTLADLDPFAAAGCPARGAAAGRRG